MHEIDRQKIEDYLQGRLEGAALEAFLLQLEKDPDMAKELNIQQMLLEQIDALGDRKMKDKLQQIKQRVGQKDVIPLKRRRLYRWTAAAAAILLLLLAVPWYLSTPNLSNEQLYAQHYEAYPLPLASRGGNGESPQIAEAGRLYRGKDFQQLLPLLSELTLAQPKDARLQLAQGIALMELKQYQKAISILLPQVEQIDGLYHSQARWYTALAQLQLGNIEACKIQLQFLSSSPQARFHQEAKELLKKLK